MKLHDLPRASGVPSNPNTGANSKPPEGTPEARRCCWCGASIDGSYVKREACSATCSQAQWRAKRSARSLCAAVHARGWPGSVIAHPAQGLCVEAWLPGVQGPVLLVCADDLAWLLIDLRRVA